MTQKVVSSFEYAIMKAMNESYPDKVTDEDLSKVRPITAQEKQQQIRERFESIASKIRIKP